MWCQRCQQDMPAITQAGTGALVCSRCQHDFQSVRSAHATAISDHGIPLDEGMPCTPQDPVARLSDWETEQRFRRMARTLHRGGDLAAQSAAPTSSSRHRRHYRVDPPQSVMEKFERLPARPYAAASPMQRMPSAYRVPRASSAGSQFMSWLVVFLGILIFACGVGLGYQSLIESEPLYWEIAVGLALVGQGLLILGLVLVLSWLWRNSQHATNQLQEIHWQLGEVQRAAQAIVGQHQRSAPAFYAELARGASPQTLLASLRGQLEQLSARLNS